MNIELKLKLLERLHDQLDAHVMDIARRYVDVTGDCPNGMYPWMVEGNVIVFHGSGDYDLDIPLKFFIDTEAEFAKLERKMAKQEENHKKYLADWERKSELAELERLQLKYMSKSGVQTKF